MSRVIFCIGVALAAAPAAPALAQYARYAPGDAIEYRYADEAPARRARSDRPVVYVAPDGRRFVYPADQVRSEAGTPIRQLYIRERRGRTVTVIPNIGEPEIAPPILPGAQRRAIRAAGAPVYVPGNPRGGASRVITAPPRQVEPEPAQGGRIIRYAGVREPMVMRPQVADQFKKQTVDYHGPHGPGTIVIDTSKRFLYLVQDGGKALRYGIGVGRDGFQWKGTHKVTAKREWPSWRPPAEMRKRQPGLPVHMAGGPNNPLGARALYLGSTLYRIHGSNEPWTIGHAVSSGCFRMTNDDVIDLYKRVSVGAKVVVN